MSSSLSCRWHFASQGSFPDVSVKPRAEKREGGNEEEKRGWESSAENNAYWDELCSGKDEERESKRKRLLKRMRNSISLHLGWIMIAISVGSCNDSYDIVSIKRFE